MTRKKVPNNIEAQVLDACKRRCALCVAIDENHDEAIGQIAHLDKDNTNFKLENLVFLCLRHHTLYDSKNSQHKNYTLAEVVIYRERVNAQYKSNLKPEERQFVHTFLEKNAPLLQYIMNVDNHIAVEIDAEIYEFFREYVSSIPISEKLCFNKEIASALKELNYSMDSIWTTISDSNYIPSGWRWKFDNTHDPGRNVQGILADKKLEITPHLIAVANYFEIMVRMA